MAEKAKTLEDYAKSTALKKDARELILSETFEPISKSRQNGVEICDILQNYNWTIDKVKEQGEKTIDIPHCYALEYMQLHNSTVTNMLNVFSAAANTLTGNNDLSVNDMIVSVQNLANSLVSTAIEEVGNFTGSDRETANKINGKFRAFTSGIFEGLDKSSKITNGISNASFLKPYSLLYWLKSTEFRYTFPMVSNPPTQKLSNSFGDGNQDTSPLSSNSIISTLSDFVGGVPGLVRDIQDIRNAWTGSQKSWNGTMVEKAKFFQYPQDTEEYTISFPLINTVHTESETPVWVKNYKFIFLFVLRNMIFRKDNASFYPPLFYDLVIPGVIRQPFCYVSSVDVVPFGMSRMKTCPEIFNFAKGKKMQVSVPEMWIVTIKFKSLLASSANMVLSSLFDLGVTSYGATEK